MTTKNKFRLFIIFFMTVLYASYCCMHGLPKSLLELLHATLSVAFISSLIIVVFVVTSLVFGLPLDRILKEIKK